MHSWPSTSPIAKQKSSTLTAAVTFTAWRHSSVFKTGETKRKEKRQDRKIALSETLVSATAATNLYKREREREKLVFYLSIKPHS